jgi:hypothetical protein
MRPILLILTACLALSAFTACASQGPGVDCDPCAQAEANPVGPGSQAAAAAAAGGQRANNAPFAEDTARLQPQVTIGRGQGATTSSSADSEHRQVASGGAQNLGVVLPTEANASTGGGISVAVQEAARTVAAYRSMLQCALLNPACPPDRISLLSEQLARAQESLAAAQATANAPNVTNNHFENARVQLFGISTSKTGPDEAINPDVVKPMAEAAANVLSEPSPPSTAAPTSGLSGSSLLGEPAPAPAAPDSRPSEPPAGAAPVAPPIGGGQ